MNDADYIPSPAQISQTVDNSLEFYERAKEVTVLKNSNISPLDVMWCAFIHQISQESINSHKPSPNPQISLYACCYGIPIPFSESGGGIAFAAGTTLGYDNDGNLTSYGSKSYEWDYRNRMASSTESGSGTTYGYDHNNQRVKKTHGAVTTIYPNQYYSLEGATSTRYIWAGDELVGYIEGNGAATSTYYVHADHLGSTNAVTDSTGAVSLSKDYYPYGSSRVSSGDADLARGYIGQFEDEDLSYLNARYYEGARGQFLSEDPSHLAIGDNNQVQQITGKPLQQYLTDPQSLNSYSYARNNPVINKDPNGKQFVETGVGIAYLLAWSGFVNFALQQQIGDYEIETMKNYPDQFSQQEINSAQEKLDRDKYYQAVGVVFGAVNNTAGLVLDAGGLVNDFAAKVLKLNTSGSRSSVSTSMSQNVNNQNVLVNNNLSNQYNSGIQKTTSNSSNNSSNTSYSLQSIANQLNQIQRQLNIISSQISNLRSSKKQ